jgi:hypothetical protein
MPTVRQIIQRLFPNGTNPGTRRDWRRFPEWPPDAFAIAATLVDLSGSYCRPRYLSGENGGCLFAGDQHLKLVHEISPQWGGFNGVALSRPARRVLQRLWDDLIDTQCGEIREWDDPFAMQWCDAAIRILCLADSASRGIGFLVQPVGKRPVADFVFQQHQYRLQMQPGDLPHIPWSLCNMVPPEEVCVQPKTRTAQVGCTLRSWSHHLALLPSVGEAATTWLIGSDPEVDDETPPEQQRLNLLFVPFPYSVHANCFASDGSYLGGGDWPAHHHDRRQWRFFHLSQNWLHPEGITLTATDITRFVNGLIEVAERESGRVDGVVLPELALNEVLAREVARNLASQRNIELFIAGIAVPSDEKRHMPRNCAYSCIHSQGKFFTDWMQSKHHRWKLEKSQIQRYHLADRLHPEAFWWEYINIENRQCAFYVFRQGMSLVTLICEDLARIDPMQSVIRAVGPNLVVALLMDGPQWKDRWGARYATVLADDPGSAVLVLTSMGFLRRQAGLGGELTREVLLWKGAEGTPISISLAKDNHALLITLTTVKETNCTLDGRSDEGHTFGLAMSEVRQVRHSAPPSWAANP